MMVVDILFLPSYVSCEYFWSKGKVASIPSLLWQHAREAMLVYVCWGSDTATLWGEKNNGVDQNILLSVLLSDMSGISGLQCCFLQR